MFPFSGDPFSLRHGHSGDMRRVTFITRSETHRGEGQGIEREGKCQKLRPCFP